MSSDATIQISNLLFIVALWVHREKIMLTENQENGSKEFNFSSFHLQTEMVPFLLYEMQLLKANSLHIDIQNRANKKPGVC